MTLDIESIHLLKIPNIKPNCPDHNSKIVMSKK